MNLRIKLISSFLMLASLAAVLGLLNARSNQIFHERTEEINQQLIPRISALQNIKIYSLRLITEVASYRLIKAESKTGTSISTDDFNEEIEEFKEAKLSLENELENFQFILSQSTQEQQTPLSAIAEAQAKVIQICEDLINPENSNLSGPSLLAKRRELEVAEEKLVNLLNQSIAANSEAFKIANNLAEANARTAMKMNMASVAIVAIAACILALVLAESIAHPIIKIKEAAIQIGQGKLNVRVNAKSRGEIGVLAQSFNQMADNLAKTTVSKSYVDNIIKSMIDALIILEPDTTIKNFNLAAFLMLKYEEKELIGQSIESVFAKKDFFSDWGIDELNQNSFLGRKETLLLSKNGEEIPVYFSASILRDSDNQIQGFVCLAQDITELKQVEAALQKSKAELEIRVEERTAELTFANEQLQQEIQERQLVADALRESKERLNGILNSLDDVVSSATANHNELLYLSPATQEVFGYPVQDFLENPNLWFQVVHPEDRDRVQNSVSQCFQTGSADIEYRILHPTAGIRWLRSRSRPVYNANATPIRIDGISTDITQRKEAEEALRQSEARYRKLAKREALLNQLASQIRTSLDLDTILETAVCEIRNLLQIDQCLFVWYRLNIAADRNPDYRHKIIKSDTSLAIWDVVKESTKPGLASALGQYPAATMQPIAARLLKLEILRIDDVETISDPLLKEFYREQGYTAYLALPIRTSAHEIGIVSCGHCHGFRPWRDTEVAMLQAITDQLAIALFQAELYAQANQSALVAQQRAEQLQKTLKTLQQTQAQLIQTEKMSSLGQMVAGVAHEINNPVSFIYGNIDPASDYIQDLLHLLQLYEQHYPDPDPEITEEVEEIDLDFLRKDLPKLLDSMKIGAERIREIVLSLRSFSRLDEAEMKSVDLHLGIDSTLLILQHRLKPKGTQAEIQVIKNYGSLPLVQCFPGQLNQVFMNLLSNAIDALDKQALPRIITIKTALKNSETSPQQNPQLSSTDQPSFTAHESCVLIEIIDNGPGMSADIQQRIFDPFFTTKPVGAGTGLGLSISYQIVVERHKGQLACTSVPGEGAKFTIELPVRQTINEPPIFAE